MTFNIANKLVLKKIHERIGLDCVKIAVSGAAPIHTKTIEFFMSINIPLLELYGMSENSGPHSLNLIDNWRVGSVGHSISGTKLKIDNPDENGEGEVTLNLWMVCGLGEGEEGGWRGSTSMFLRASRETAPVCTYSIILVSA